MNDLCDALDDLEQHGLHAHTPALRYDLAVALARRQRPGDEHRFAEVLAKARAEDAVAFGAPLSHLEDRHVQHLIHGQFGP